LAGLSGHAVPLPAPISAPLGWLLRSGAWGATAARGGSQSIASALASYPTSGRRDTDRPAESVDDLRARVVPRTSPPPVVDRRDRFPAATVRARTLPYGPGVFCSTALTARFLTARLCVRRRYTRRTPSEIAARNAIWWETPDRLHIIRHSPAFDSTRAPDGKHTAGRIATSRTAQRSI
jgi:hypothetical protein